MFDWIWKTYPSGRKSSRVTARKSFDKLKCDLDLFNNIITDIEKRKEKDVKWQDTKYIPMLTTYMNQQRWEGDMEEKKAKEEENKTPSKKVRWWETMGFSSKEEYEKAHTPSWEDLAIMIKCNPKRWKNALQKTRKYSPTLTHRMNQLIIEAEQGQMTDIPW